MEVLVNTSEITELVCKEVDSPEIEVLLIADQLKILLGELAINGMFTLFPLQMFVELGEVRKGAGTIVTATNWDGPVQLLAVGVTL